MSINPTATRILDERYALLEHTLKQVTSEPSISRDAERSIRENSVSVEMKVLRTMHLTEEEEVWLSSEG